MTPPEQCAAIYVRRSSAAVGSNRSLMEQETEARALAERQGLKIVDVYREREGTGASARSGKARPQWAAAVAELDAGTRFHTIIVWALDRADRRGSDTLGAMLSQHAATGRRILGVDGTDTSDPQQRLATIVRGEIAREYSEKLGDNIARTKRYRREDGPWLGGKPPWGLRIGPDRKLERDPETYGEARRVAEALLNGATLYSVALDLNERRVRMPNGAEWGSTSVRKARGKDEDVVSAPQQWRPSTLASIARSPGWAGLQGIRHREVREDGTKGGWPATAEVYRSIETGEPVSVGEGVITAEERSVILARIESRRGTTESGARVGRKPISSLLGERLKCATCSSYGVRRIVAGRSYYKCRTATEFPGRCEGFTAPTDGIEDYVVGRVVIFLSSLDLGNEVTRKAFAEWVGETDPEVLARRRAQELTREAAQADLDRTRRLAISGVITEEEAAAELPRLRAALADAEAALERAGRGSQEKVDSLRDVQYLAQAWDDLDIEAQRRIVNTAVRHITIRKAPYMGARFVGPQRAVVTFSDGSTWPRNGEYAPFPGRSKETIRKQKERERRAQREAAQR